MHENKKIFKTLLSIFMIFLLGLVCFLFLFILNYYYFTNKVTMLKEPFYYDYLSFPDLFKEALPLLTEENLKLLLQKFEILLEKEDIKTKIYIKNIYACKTILQCNFCCNYGFNSHLMFQHVFSALQFFFYFPYENISMFGFCELSSCKPITANHRIFCYENYKQLLETFLKLILYLNEKKI